MTTVAWDGRVMAADSLASFGGTPVMVNKVWRIAGPDGRPWLVGAAGATGQCQAAIRWMAGQAPQPGELDDCTRMAVDMDGMVWQANGLLWCPIGRRPWAIGSGADYALGAMAGGADARAAVDIAAKLDINTGGLVKVASHTWGVAE